ncbi:MAG: cupin domain-containing protein [Pseudomonadota bacterium]
MYIKSETSSESYVANDGCRITELIHPKHFDFNLGDGLNFSFAVAEVAVGEQTYQHILDQHEVYYVLAGVGEMHIDEEIAEINAREAVLIPAGSVQWIKNIGDCVLRFVAVVSPPWTAEGDHRIA